jgi:hypothetical protein
MLGKKTQESKCLIRRALLDWSPASLIQFCLVINSCHRKFWPRKKNLRHLDFFWPTFDARSRAEELNGILGRFEMEKRRKQFLLSNCFQTSESSRIEIGTQFFFFPAAPGVSIRAIPMGGHDLKKDGFNLDKSMVARWFVLRPKIPIRVYFGVPWNGHCWYIFTAMWYNLWPFGSVYGRLVVFMAVWLCLWPFGCVYGRLVVFMAVWKCLWPFGSVYGRLVVFMAVW